MSKQRYLAAADADGVGSVGAAWRYVEGLRVRDLSVARRVPRGRARLGEGAGMDAGLVDQVVDIASMPGKGASSGVLAPAQQAGSSSTNAAALAVTSS